MSSRTRQSLICLGLLGLVWVSEARAQGVTPELALKFKPIQKDVEYDTPTAAEIPNCKVEVIRGESGSGWVVYGTAGETLRRFMDTNGDNTVDQWSYYRAGIEVYRDNDTNFNSKVDSSRWLNTGGSRWGIDANEDGRIDRWKLLSAEEAARVAFHALVTQDGAALQTVLVDENDLRELGIEAELAKRLKASVSDPAAQIRKILSDSKALTAQTKWMRFDGASPGLIPADSGKAKGDLHVYENAMAIIENSGDILLLQFGEMVRIGDVWKLTQIPRPVEANSTQVQVGGILLEPETSSSGEVAIAPSSTSPEARKLLDDLQKLDTNSPALDAGAEAIGRYNKSRADILQELVRVSKTDEERELWLRQMVDGLAAAVQTGGYPAGLARLQTLEETFAKAKSPLLPYVKHRRMTAEFSQRAVATAPEKQEELQKWWMESLEAFVKDHPQSSEAAEAAFQIASSQEIGGNVDEAKKWYQRIETAWKDTLESQKAAGALRRLALEGKSFDFSGPMLDGKTYNLAASRGKVVLLVYWASWCEPCLADVPALETLLRQHGPAGFEIVGINLDIRREEAEQTVRTAKISWPQVREEGGLDSPPAVKLGVLLPPTMILVDPKGQVVSANATLEVVKQKVPELLKK